MRENYLCSYFMLRVTLHHDWGFVLISALVVSGVAINLIDHHLVEEVETFL